ncbi:MAG: TlpA family protein disulfide reductase [Phycisphaerae bacterium]|nr:TlpA family protein disulfide reductase [Phycisphaerae bacterium]NUQ47968.1 TlpA family protein disulfide reductase [Phycisphaerae bacterium]
MKWIRIFTFIAWTPGAAMLASGCAQPDRPSPGQARAQRAAGEVADPVGATLDSFAFSTLDGRPLAWDATTQTLDAPGGGVKPRLLAVHVFQPDCNACQEQARSLQRLHVKGAADSIAVVGITHRGDAAAAREFVRKFGVTYPIAAATGTDWAGRWGRGDPMFLVGNDGKIVYSQEGYQPTDLDIWWAVAADVRDGRVVAFRHPQRSGEKLTTGDVLPAIELPDLMTGRALALRVDDGKLAFVDGDGRSHPCRASIGFFSRY